VIAEPCGESRDFDEPEEPALISLRRRSAMLMIHGDRPVIITVIPMWMMQVVVNQVVKVITVGNGLM
jgi:hypothetical protein